MKIALVDYRAGNLTSVRKALAALGARVHTPAAPGDIAGSDAVIVPGVGNFQATAALDEPWREAILAAVGVGRPLLGICLGMQWLFDGSDEAPDLRGLGLFGGSCTRLGDSGTDAPRLKVPHVGWNSLSRRGTSVLLDDVGGEAWVYFTHSFAAPVTPDCTASTAYGAEFAAVVERGLVFGVQFHPEKSGEAGLRILKNFLSQVDGSERGVPSSRFPVPSELTPAMPLSIRTGPLRPDLEHRELGTGNRERTGIVTPKLAKRIIACLDVRDGQVVKGVRFEELRRAGDPAALAARYNREGIDEVVILDITATIEGRRTLAETVRAVAAELFIPLAVGGGIRTEADADAAIEAGADKVSLNTAALADPPMLTTLARRYGSQAVIVAIDAKREGGRFAVYGRSGRAASSRDAVEWAREAADRGAGEVLLTSIDRDGTRSGFDCDLTAAVSAAVPIPVIASGGAGGFDDFVDVFTRGLADAALAASIFHYAEHTVADLKRHLQGRGIPVRL